MWFASLQVAEREGFEPPVPLSTTVFKTVVIDHSTISPLSRRQALCSKASAKVMSFSYSSKFFQRKFINIRYFSIKTPVGGIISSGFTLVTVSNDDLSGCKTRSFIS